MINLNEAVVVDLDQFEAEISQSRQILEESPKISAILKILQESRDQDPSVKTLIFSPYVSFLELIGVFLSKQNFSFLTISGNVSERDRSSIIEDFQHRNTTTVLLISLMAGSEGVTLTAASQVIFANQWYNPFQTLQAIARANRIGQKKPVKVFNLFLQDTFEERIMDIQALKLDTVDSIFENASQLSFTSIVKNL